jgi:hypothetical protein
MHPISSAVFHSFSTRAFPPLTFSRGCSLRFFFGGPDFGLVFGHSVCLQLR